MPKIHLYAELFDWTEVCGEGGGGGGEGKEEEGKKVGGGGIKCFCFLYNVI